MAHVRACLAHVDVVWTLCGRCVNGVVNFVWTLTWTLYEPFVDVAVDLTRALCGPFVEVAWTFHGRFGPLCERSVAAL